MIHLRLTLGCCQAIWYVWILLLIHIIRGGNTSSFHSRTGRRVTLSHMNSDSNRNSACIFEVAVSQVLALACPTKDPIFTRRSRRTAATTQQMSYTHFVMYTRVDFDLTAEIIVLIFKLNILFNLSSQAYIAWLRGTWSNKDFYPNTWAFWMLPWKCVPDKNKCMTRFHMCGSIFLKQYSCTFLSQI